MANNDISLIAALIGSTRISTEHLEKIKSSKCLKNQTTGRMTKEGFVPDLMVSRAVLDALSHGRGYLAVDERGIPRYVDRAAVEAQPEEGE